MTVTALVVAVLACLAIVGIGVRFLLVPDRPLADFGLPTASPAALAAIKGVRDITSGIVLLVVWAAGGQDALGWGLVAAAVTPLGDMLIVLTHGGRRAAAFGIHGPTAVVLVAAGLVLALA